jgi:hypothetical protein
VQREKLRLGRVGESRSGFILLVLAMAAACVCGCTNVRAGQVGVCPTCQKEVSRDVTTMRVPLWQANKYRVETVAEYCPVCGELNRREDAVLSTFAYPYGAFAGKSGLPRMYETSYDGYDGWDAAGCCWRYTTGDGLDRVDQYVNDRARYGSQGWWQYASFAASMGQTGDSIGADYSQRGSGERVSLSAWTLGPGTGSTIQIVWVYPRRSR